MNDSIKSLTNEQKKLHEKAMMLIKARNLRFEQIGKITKDLKENAEQIEVVEAIINLKIMFL